MLQSLVMIGEATLEIRRQKEHLNYSGKTQWPAAIAAGVWLVFYC